MYYPSDEINIVEGLINGQKEAFEKVYAAYHYKVYKLAIKFVKSEEIAKEVVQDVFVKIWVSRHTINKELSFSAYLFTIAHNHIFNLLKRAAKETSLKSEILAAAELTTNQTEDAVITAEYESLASHAIEHLPPQRKIVFKLCRQEGKSYEEVAQELGISKSTVKDHMVKAVKTIKEYLHIHTQASFLYLLALYLHY